MKKLLVIGFAMLLGVGAMAQTIVGSAHDFSATGWTTNQEICIACHTPHNGDMTVANTPLWNHEVTAATFQLYVGNGTFDATDAGQPAGISKLCLSCHDGTVALDSFGGVTGSTNITGSGLVGTDLRDDHPVSFTYDATLYAADPGLEDPSGAAVAALLYSDKVECSSCHDVHNGSGATSLLVMSNANSALCLTCHNK